MNFNIIRRLSLAARLLGILLLTAGVAKGESVTYTFEQFGADGQTAPLLNITPDRGPSSFSANFTSTPTENGFLVASFQPNSLFAGNSLFETLGNAGNTLTVAFNTPIHSLSLVFACNGSATLEFISPSGSTSVASSLQDGLFQGGTLTFASENPFTTFSLMDGDGAPEFAIDNVTMRFAAVPDAGSTLAMASIAALLAIGYHRLRCLKV